MSEKQELLEARGALLRRLDFLRGSLEKARANLVDPNYITMTGELENLKDEARYFFADAGPLAQGALREISSMKFRGSRSRKPRSSVERARVRSGGVLPSERPNIRFQIEASKNIGRMIELVQRVQEKLTRQVIRRTVLPSPLSATLAPKPIRDLKELRRLKSISQKQAALELGVSERTIRTRVRGGELRQTAIARIITDDEAFEKQFTRTHSPKI